MTRTWVVRPRAGIRSQAKSHTRVGIGSQAKDQNWNQSQRPGQVSGRRQEPVIVQESWNQEQGREAGLKSQTRRQRLMQQPASNSPSCTDTFLYPILTSVVQLDQLVSWTLFQSGLPWALPLVGSGFHQAFNPLVTSKPVGDGQDAKAAWGPRILTLIPNTEVFLSKMLIVTLSYLSALELGQKSESNLKSPNAGASDTMESRSDHPCILVLIL